MILDSVLTQVQQFSNLPVFHAFCDLGNDLLLPAAQQASLRLEYNGWQALNQSLKNVPLLTTVRPHLTFAHAANAFAEVATRFVAVTYTDRARPKSLNNNLVAVFLFDFSE
jgi:hypothetical protein